MASSFEREREMKMSCSQAGIQADRLPERGDRRGEVTVVGHEHADRVVGHGVCRVQRDRRTESGECCCGVPARHERRAAFAMLRRGP